MRGLLLSSSPLHDSPAWWRSILTYLPALFGPKQIPKTPWKGWGLLAYMTAIRSRMICHGWCEKLHKSSLWWQRLRRGGLHRMIQPLVDRPLRSAMVRTRTSTSLWSHFLLELKICYYDVKTNRAPPNRQVKINPNLDNDSSTWAHAMLICYSAKPGITNNTSTQSNIKHLFRSI